MKIFSGFLLSIGAALLYLQSVQPAEAHLETTSGSIQAILHIEPDDAAVAGKPATFFFDIQDKNSIFQFAQCQCVLSIREAGRQMFSQTLPPSDLHTPSPSYTFSKADTYSIQLSGKPQLGGTFQSFNLVWDVQVDGVAGNQTVRTISYRLSHLWQHDLELVLVIIGSLVLVFRIELDKRRSRKSVPRH